MFCFVLCNQYFKNLLPLISGLTVSDSLFWVFLSVKSVKHFGGKEHADQLYPFEVCL